MRLIFLFINLTAIFYSATAQINDTFSDGNISADPAWQGDTSRFVVNSDSVLQLSTSGAGIAYLSTASTTIIDASWTLDVQMHFNPSSNNFADIYLVSDQSDLTMPLNGYYVRIGGTQDEVSLFRQSGTQGASIKLIDGTDKLLNTGTVTVRIKVTKNHENEWELFADPGLTGQFLLQGTANDSGIYYSKYFGLVCHYTSTRADKFYFDDLLVTGKSYEDETAPHIDTVLALADTVALIRFDEKIDSSTVNTTRFLIDKNIGNPWKTIAGDSSVELYVTTKFTDQNIYSLTVNGVKDLFGNPAIATASFRYEAPYILGYHDVLITEIMADPTPGVDLPEYEYLELYNPSEKSYLLHHVTMAVGNDTTVLPNTRMQAGAYIVLCSSAAEPHLAPYGQTLAVPNWPTLNNRGDQISMFNQRDELLLYINYDDSWYQSIDKDDGGWSLEMIDTHVPCKGAANWTAAAGNAGGTPGAPNASSGTISDLTGPAIAHLIATSENEMIVQLSESIGPQPMDLEQFFIDPDLPISDAQLLPPSFNTIHLALGADIIPGTNYELSIANLTDCANNSTPITKSKLIYPQPADSLDVLINEILFNPLPGGVDFVEIYNASQKYIDLGQLFIANKSIARLSDTQWIMTPGQYVALTDDAQLLKNFHPATPVRNIIEVPHFPAFNNDEGEVSLTNQAGKTLDFFHYSDEYHSAYLSSTEGVSLERISLSAPTNSASNWQSAASTARFATPGSANSQAILESPDKGEVTVSPLVFDPGNNGFRNFTTVHCRFQDPGSVATIYIVDATGQRVRILADHMSVGMIEDFKWDGLDDQGREVRLGYYLVFAEIINSNGQSKIHRKKVVVGHPM